MKKSNQDAKKMEQSLQNSLEELEQRVKNTETVEGKMRLILTYMQEALSRNQSPQFKEFWEARKLLVPLFQEKGIASIKNQFWKEFTELTKEGRRLKEIMEEQSSFALEQIELALEAVEADILHYEEYLSRLPSLVFPKEGKLFLQDRDFYQTKQGEIHLLSTFVQKLQALRKEILQTDMRMRKKNELFKKMSELGDLVFPKRKERIKEISERFLQEVENFISSHKKGKEIVTKIPYFLLLEEIKALQGFAKQLMLSPEVFTITREKLSELWDQIKELEKEKKKEIAEKREGQKQAFEKLQEQVASFSQKCENKEKSLKELEQEKQILEKEIRFSSLSKKDQRFFLEGVQKALAPFYEQIAQEIKEKEAKKSHKKKQVIQELKALLENPSEKLEEAYKEVHKSLDFSLLNELDAVYITHLLSHLEEKIAETKEDALQTLPHRCQKAKERLETYRKALASSNLDFSKAFLLQEIAEEEKKLYDALLSKLEEE